MEMEMELRAGSGIVYMLVRESGNWYKAYTRGPRVQKHGALLLHGCERDGSARIARCVNFLLRGWG